MNTAVSLSALYRANQLDTIAAVLPHHQRDALAALLTDDDIGTLKHLVDKGLGANTLRAMASDLAYLDAWTQAATGASLPWPAPQQLLLKFIAHHLWDVEKRKGTSGHGMPDDIADRLKGEGHLRQSGPHAPATVRRRLALWATLHHWRGLTGRFSDPHVKTALKTAMRATARTVKRKSTHAITGDVLEKLIGTCAREALRDVRDRTILLVAYASGGRRRSEIASLTVAQLEKLPPVLTDPHDPASPLLPCTAIQLGRTKSEINAQVLIVGRPAVYLQDWQTRAGITAGPVFRAIDKWGHISHAPLTPEAINNMIKQRCRLAGLDPAFYSAHGLRAGFITDAARKGVDMLDAMAQSRHRSVQQAAVYYNEARRPDSKAVRMGQ